MAVLGRYTENGSIRIEHANGSVTSIPIDPNNTDYIRILERLALGDTIAPYVPPVVDLDAQDIEEINRMLLQPGSFMRGIAMQLFKVKKFLDPSYTMNQYKIDVKGDMR